MMGRNGTENGVCCVGGRGPSCQFTSLYTKVRMASFKSIIQDMKKDETSRKGFDHVKFGYKLRSSSHRDVQDGLVVVDALKQSCWVSGPPELLRDVLMRIEALESTWPPRKNVVACAGVCRNWREIMKEIVRTPEMSGKLTFPISLKQPGPRDSLLQCYIKHIRKQPNMLFLPQLRSSKYGRLCGCTIFAALNEDGKLLLAARKLRRPTCTDYIISLNPDDVSKGGSTYIGKLRSNFLGTKFTAFDAQPPNAGSKVMKSRSTWQVNFKQVSPIVPAGNFPAVHISYKLNVLGRRGPRRMQCVMDVIPASSIEPGGVAPTKSEFMSSTLDTFPSFFFCRSKSTRIENFQSGRPMSASKDGLLVLKNKSPRWHEQLQYWCLNFHGQVTVASVKNFQLVASPEKGVIGPEHEHVILQFGKVGKDVFTMDYQYPISAFQSFAICLSSFDTRITCVARQGFHGRHSGLMRFRGSF